MVGRDACESYRSAASLREELAQVIEGATEAIVAAVQRASRSLPGKGPGAMVEGATGPEPGQVIREVVMALPGLLRARNGAGRARKNGGVGPGAHARLSPALRYRLHTLLAQTVWREVAAQAPEDWSPVVATGLQEDVHTAVSRALGSEADECVAELDGELRRRQQEHTDLCAQMLQEHEQQREQLARHMHDVVAQALAAARYHANVAQRLLPRDTAAAAKEALEAQRLIEHALAQIRRVLVELRPIALDRFGLQAAIEDYLAGLRRDSHISVVFHGNGEMPQLGPITQSVLLRMVQDVFHGMLLPLGTTAAIVRLRVEDDVANLVIEQEGEPAGDGEAGKEGASAQELRSQLALLRARAELVGGTVGSEGGVGRPARIEISVPVKNGGA